MAGKSWWNFNPGNVKRSIGVVAGTPLGASYARWMSVGAGLGAARGLFDNVIGEDKVSVLGGAIQGALTFGGFRGMKQLFGFLRRGRVSGGAFTPEIVSGMPRSSPLQLPYRSSALTRPSPNFTMGGSFASRRGRSLSPKLLTYQPPRSPFYSSPYNNPVPGRSRFWTSPW